MVRLARTFGEILAVITAEVGDDPIMQRDRAIDVLCAALARTSYGYIRGGAEYAETTRAARSGRVEAL